MKYLIMSLLWAFALFSPAFSAEMTILVEGRPIDAGPITRYGATFVPLRGVSEGLGASVEYESSIVVVRREPTKVVLRIGSYSANVNGRELPLSAAPFHHLGKVYVPLRFIAEALGAEVNHKGSIGVIAVSWPKVETPPDPPGPVIDVKPMKVAIVPWTLLDCTDGGRWAVYEAMQRLLVPAGFEIMDRENVKLTAVRALGRDPESRFDSPLPTASELLTIGETLKADFIIAGKVSWVTKPVYTIRGLITKAYTTGDCLVVDVGKKEVVCQQTNMKTDSENRNDVAAILSWVLVGFPQPISGGPKDPPHRKAGAAIVNKMLATWVANQAKRIR